MGGKEHRIFPVSANVSFSHETSAVIGVLPSNQWILLFCQAGFNLPILVALLLIYRDVGRQRRHFPDSLLIDNVEKHSISWPPNRRRIFSNNAFSLNYGK